MGYPGVWAGIMVDCIVEQDIKSFITIMMMMMMMMH